jgi:FkbM family methyltransferase
MNILSYVNRILEKVKLGLVSHYIFDNWLSLLVKYTLTKLGFNVKLMARVKNCIFEVKPETFAALVSGFKDGFIKSIECSNGKIFVNKIEIVNVDDVVYDAVTSAKVLGWIYDSVNKYWIKGNVRFRHMYRPILEVFDYGHYESLNVVGRVVVDVGAFIGDSAIYFALKGARRVVAVEPHPGAYAEMLDNIRLNNLEGVIVPVNAGLASKSWQVCVGDADVSDTLVTYHRTGDCPNTIPAVTLGELINRFSIGSDDAVLKMDCEGCEFDVILNDYEHVRLFRELIFEYHSYAVNKPVSDLLNMLSRDYECDVRGGEDFGIMHCIRK